MKKTFMLLLILLLAALVFTASADEMNSDAITGRIENSSYIIRIPVADSDMGWHADEIDPEGAAVKLADAKMEDGCFVVRYDPVADGQTTVTVRHFYCAIASDQAHTWDLSVQDGKIQEVTGGSFTALPEEEEVDPYFSGTWLEKDTQFTRMTVAKNEARGWDVEIISPLTHGAYKFVATVYQDCCESAFLYDKGKLFSLPADYTEGMDLGEAEVAGATGVLKFEEKEGALSLIWVRDENPDEIVIFDRVSQEPAAE